MTIKVEHELHTRRWGRNLGLGLILGGLVAIIFGLTMVKILELDSVRDFQSFDHVSQPRIVTEEAGQ